jgi:hypothetical protein
MSETVKHRLPTNEILTFNKFHQLWTECVGTVTYNKQAWKSIETQLIANGLIKAP